VYEAALVAKEGEIGSGFVESKDEAYRVFLGRCWEVVGMVRG
jgi:hypothetical protein